MKGLGWFVVSVLLFLVVLQVSGRLAGPESAAGGAPGRTPPSGPAVRSSVPIPPDTGAKAAKVVLEVFMKPRQRRKKCGCGATTPAIGRAVGKLDPERVRVVFRDLTLSGNQARLNKLGVEVLRDGFAICGHSKFEIPCAGRSGGKTRTVDFLGTNAWSIADLHTALAEQYLATYRAALPMTRQDFLRAVSNEIRAGRAAATASK